MTDRYRTGSGAALHVEDTGTGPPILALPGLGGGAWFFGGFAKRLAPDYRIVSVDLPGTGRSASPGGAFSAESWVDDLGGLVRTRLARPVVILGHSMGTILALKAWQAWPEHIHALIFVGGLPEARPLIRERLSARADEIARDGMGGWGPRVSAGVFARATLDRQPELVALFERLFETEDAGRYVRCCEILLGASAAAVVPGVRIPCLSVTGADDQYAPPDLVDSFMRQVPGPCRVQVMPGCGHLPFLEAPDAFADLVRSFLQTVC